MKYVLARIDWNKRAAYIWDRHQVDPVWADEAAADPESCWLDPDPASISGLSVWVIGYLVSAAAVLTVILLPGDAARVSLPTVTGGA